MHKVERRIHKVLSHFNPEHCQLHSCYWCQNFLLTDPWRDFEEHGATAASPESFFRNSDRSSEGFQRPYSCDMPLGKTSGLVDVLRSCPWRKLADVLGMYYR